MKTRYGINTLIIEEDDKKKFSESNDEKIDTDINKKFEPFLTHLQDETGRIQIMFSRDVTAVSGFSSTPEMTALKFIEKKIDLYDRKDRKNYTYKSEWT